MVKGLDVFTDYFKDFTDQYILIGGAACDFLISEAAMIPRATNDLDVVLIIEALTKEFAYLFKDFVKEGDYLSKEQGTTKKEYFRFKNPQNHDFPVMIELISRKPDNVELFKGEKFTPIPVEEELTSLAAIIMDNDYYDLTIENSDVVNGLRLANTDVLICLKAKAFINLKTERDKGNKKIQSKDIKKHKGDIVRLAGLLKQDNSMQLPASVNDTLKEYIEIMKNEEQNYFDSISQSLAAPAPIIKDEVLGILESYYRLK